MQTLKTLTEWMLDNDSDDFEEAREALLEAADELIDRLADEARERDVFGD